MKKQCGPAIILPKQGGAAESMWCVLDKWPRHKMHLLVPAEKVPEGVDRDMVIRKFKLLVGGEWR